MIIKEHRIQILALFTGSVISILLMAIFFWNRGIKADIQFGFWPLLFLIMSLLGLSGFLVIHLKLASTKKINKLIQEKVTEERLKMLAEFEKKKEKEVDITKETKLEAGKIIPTGSFKSEESFAKKLLLNLSNSLQVSIGIYYSFNAKSKKYQFLTGFALTGEKPPPDFKAGENLNGQVAESKQLMILKNVPENYFKIESGMGKSKPGNIIIAPIVNNNRTIAIIEIATFIEADAELEKMIHEVCEISGKKLEQINKS